MQTQTLVETFECPDCGADLAFEDDTCDCSAPGEDAITTEDHSSFYQYGKLWLFVHPDCDTEEMNAQIRERMNEQQFWPDVWFISDHGNAHPMDISPEV